MSKNHPLLVYLKWGGSLITEKDRPRTPRPNTLARLAGEVASALHDRRELRLVLGHGSGSYGHAAAARNRTREGVHTSQEWRGFAEVWRDANALNRLVVDALLGMGLPVISFPPSAALSAEDGRAVNWNTYPITAALEAGLLPVIQGDVIFDTRLGGTILSTEDLFGVLAQDAPPARLLLAGRDPGVWADFPACTRLLKEITPEAYAAGLSVGGSASTDVTGGMKAKVEGALALVREHPALEVCVFSGEEDGAVYDALLGESPGTRIHA